MLMMLRMIFITIVSLIVVNIKIDNIFILMIQDLFYIPLIVCIGYFVFIFFASQPDEPFPNFKRFIKQFKTKGK